MPRGDVSGSMVKSHGGAEVGARNVLRKRRRVWWSREVRVTPDPSRLGGSVTFLGDSIRCRSCPEREWHRGAGWGRCGGILGIPDFANLVLPLLIGPCICVGSCSSVRWRCWIFRSVTDLVLISTLCTPRGLLMQTSLRSYPPPTPSDWADP